MERSSGSEVVNYHTFLTVNIYSDGKFEIAKRIRFVKKREKQQMKRWKELRIKVLNLIEL